MKRYKDKGIEINQFHVVFIFSKAKGKLLSFIFTVGRVLTRRQRFHDAVRIKVFDKEDDPWVSGKLFFEMRHDLFHAISCFR